MLPTYKKLLKIWLRFQLIEVFERFLRVISVSVARQPSQKTQDVNTAFVLKKRGNKQLKQQKTFAKSLIICKHFNFIRIVI